MDWAVYDFDDSQTVILGPAYVGGKRPLIAVLTGVNRREHADRIVLAVNCHDELLAVCKQFALLMHAGISLGEHGGDESAEQCATIMAMARNAISKAEAGLDVLPGSHA